MGGRVDVVLDRERNAVERQALRTAALELGGARLQLSRRQPVDPDPVFAAPGDALEDPGYRLRRPQRPRGVARSQGGKIEGVVRLQHRESIL